MVVQAPQSRQDRTLSPPKLPLFPMANTSANASDMGEKIRSGARWRLALLLLLLVAGVSVALLLPRLREWQLARASAEALAEQAAREPRRADVQYYLGLRQMAAGNVEAAATALRRAVELAPDRPAYRLEFARALRRGGADGRAYEQLQQVVKQAPDLAEAQFGLGLLLAEHGREQEAEAPLTRATELTPDDVDAWYALGRCLADIRQEPRAEAAYRRALALNPRFVGALLGLGDLLARGGRDAEAIPILTRARELAPEDPEGWRLLGAIRSRMARTQAEARAAEGLLRGAAQRAPSSSAAHDALGMHLLRQGRYNEAVPELRAAAALDPSDTGALFSLGRALRLAGRKEEAQQAFAEFARRSDYERQARYLSMRIDRMPENSDLYVRLGDLHAAHGARDRAIFEYQRALQRRPGDAAIQRKLAALQTAGAR
jgi:Flp pilus assembly protein TadD